MTWIKYLPHIAIGVIALAIGGWIYYLQSQLNGALTTIGVLRQNLANVTENFNRAATRMGIEDRVRLEPDPFGQLLERYSRPPDGSVRGVEGNPDQPGR